MADAIIFRRRGGDAPSSNPAANLVNGTQSNVGNWWTAIFTQNGYFKAGTAKGNQYWVMLFGGGGGGAYATNNGPIWAGGGGGDFNRGVFTLTPNTNIVVTVGKGGKWFSPTADEFNNWASPTLNAKVQNARGTPSSFGTYLATNITYGAALSWDGRYSGGGSSGGGIYASYVWRHAWCGEQDAYAEWGFGGGGIYANWYYTFSSSMPGPSSGGVYGGCGGSYLKVFEPHGGTFVWGTKHNVSKGGIGGLWVGSISKTGSWSDLSAQYNLGIDRANKKLTWSGTPGYQDLKQNIGSTPFQIYAQNGQYASNTGIMYPNGTYMGGSTAKGGSYGGGAGGYCSNGGSYGGGGGGYCADGGWYGGGGGGFGVNGYGGNNGGGGGAYGRGGGPSGAPLYGGGGWGYSSSYGNGANGIVIVQWYAN